MDCSGLFWSWGWTDVGARVRLVLVTRWVVDAVLDGAEHQIIY